MDIPPGWGDKVLPEVPALIGGGIGALLAAKGFWPKIGYFIFGYGLGKYATPLVDKITGFGSDVAAILAGAFGLLLIELCVRFLKGINWQQVSNSATERLQALIGRARK